MRTEGGRARGGGCLASRLGDTRRAAQSAIFALTPEIARGPQPVIRRWTAGLPGRFGSARVLMERAAPV